MTIIKLSKKLAIPKDGRTFVANLEEVVNNLSSIPFDRRVNLFHRKEHYTAWYNIDYGENTVKDKSGAPNKETVLGIDVVVDTLRQLRKQVKIARETEEPNFKIKYKELEFVEGQTGLDLFFGSGTIKKGYGDYNRLQRIEIHEADSSTWVETEFEADGLVKVSFRYNERSYQREIARVKKGVSKLEERGYKKIGTFFW